MARTGRVCRATAGTVVIFAFVSCGTLESSVDTIEMDVLPRDTVGVVSVGPSELPFDIDSDKTTVFAFDKDGKVVGQVDGNAILYSQILAFDGKLVSASSDSVKTLTTESTFDVPIHEDMIEAAVEDRESGRATLWFNSGIVDGNYSTRFVSINNDNAAHSGIVPGMVITSAYCGNSLFAVAEDQASVSWGQPAKSWLYEIAPGSQPVIKGEWEYPDGFRPVSREAACSPDGASILALFASNEAAATETGTPGLTLVRVNLSDGSREETELDMPGYTWRTPRGSVALLDGRLFWATTNGEILSVPAAGSSQVTQVWKLPAGGINDHTISINGNTVTQVDYRNTPTYTEYDLLTGTPTNGPLELPWLDPIIDSTTESGKATYTVTDVASLQR